MPAPVDIQQDLDAAWAQRFRNSSTNLAQRARYTEDIGKAEDNQRLANQAAARRRLETDPGARDLMKAEANIENQQAQRRQAEERLSFDREKDFMLQQHRANDLELRQRNERRAIEKDLRDQQNAMRIDDHTRNVENDVQYLIGDRGFLEGTPEFAQGVIQSVLKNPFITKEYRDTLFKAAKIKGDPDVIVAQAKSMGLEPSGATFDPQDGNLVLRFKSPTPEKTPPEKPRDFAKEAGTLRSDWIKTMEAAGKAKDEGQRQMLENEANLLFQELKKVRSESRTPSQASAPAATVSKTAPNPAAKLPPGFSIIGSPSQSSPPPDERE